MSSKITCEEVGTLSTFYNQVLWIIPEFHDFEKNIRFKSPQFTVVGGIWQLRFCSFRSVLSSKEWLDIGVKLLSKTSEFQGGGVRFGIIGNNLEISKTLGPNASKYASLTLSHEHEMYDWVPGGNLCLFFSMKRPGANFTSDAFLEAEMGNEDSELTNENPCSEVSTQTEKEMVDIDLKGKDDFEQTNQNAFVEVSTQTEDIGIWKLRQDLKDFLVNGKASDIILKVEDEEFRSHRSILAARSPVFLEKVMQDTEVNTGDLSIRDVDPKTFSLFLDYLYTGAVGDVTPENVLKLFAVANEYKVQELINVCMDHMLSCISVDNFCGVLAASLLQEREDLISACSEFFMKNSLDIIITTEWQLFLKENPVVANGLYIRLLQMNK